MRKNVGKEKKAPLKKKDLKKHFKKENLFLIEKTLFMTQFSRKTF